MFMCWGYQFCLCFYKFSIRFFLFWNCSKSGIFFILELFQVWYFFILELFQVSYFCYFGTVSTVWYFFILELFRQCGIFLFWNCSDSVVFFLFWNCSDCGIFFILELFQQCGIFIFWNCSDSVVFFWFSFYFRTFK